MLSPVTMAVLTITTAAGLDAALIREVAAGQPVAIAPGLAGAVQRRCAEARAAMRDGGPVYGVNTGRVALVGVPLTEHQQRAHQRNLMLARATGDPPWRDAAHTRGPLAGRLLAFPSWDSLFSAARCQR